MMREKNEQTHHVTRLPEMKTGRKQKTKKNNPLLLEAEKTLSLCLRKKKESFSFTHIIIS